MYKTKERLVEDFCKLLTANYGYSENQLGLDVNMGRGAVADIAIWKSKEEKEKRSLPDVCVLVNVKSEHIDIEEDDYFSKFKLASFQNIVFFVACNLKEKKVFFIDKKARPLKIEKINDFPQASDLVDEKKLIKFIMSSRNYSKEQFLKVLNKCHNIIRNMDKLSPEAAFDEISKVLFIKIEYEKKNNGNLTFSNNVFLDEESKYSGENSYISYLFDEIKSKYLADQLFDPTEPVRLKRETFLSVLEELGSIDLKDSSEDIKGIAFESYLGKTFRGELGQFFTPRTIVDFMVEVLDIKEGETVCDPCCGSGGFLIKAFDTVQKQIDVDVQNKIRKALDNHSIESPSAKIMIERLLEECNKNKYGSRYYKLCHDYFFGVDANARMARTSKMNMIMHGDGHVGVYLHDGLFNVGRVFENSFDVILINPPFGARVEKITKIALDDVPTEEEKRIYKSMFGEEYLKKVFIPIKQYAESQTSSGEKGTYLLDLFKLESNTTEILFIERCLNLLKPGGRAGIVLPEGILDNAVHQKVREFVERRAKIINITSIPSDVFVASGASIKPSILFIQKLKDGEILGDYDLTLSTVKDAGITSNGLPSKGNELGIVAQEILDFKADRNINNLILTKIVKKSSMKNWSVKQNSQFSHIKFNPAFKIVKLKEVLTRSNNFVKIEPDKIYSRIKVKLFNRGLTKRDELLGKKIGTKRQTRVKTGDFIISKIDGKSGAFGIVDKDLNNSIVTPDFLVYIVNEEKVFPPFLLLLLQNEKILESFSTNSSGTTGRQRLSREVFEETHIGLPSLNEQKEMTKKILETELKIAHLEDTLENLKNEFLNKTVAQ